MEKTDSSLTIRLIDEKGNEIGLTYPKRAKGLVKSGRAEFVDENTLLLYVSNSKVEEKILSSKNEENLKKKTKGLAKIKIPTYSLGEELTNAISHGLGAAISFAIATLCIIWSAKHHDPYAVVSSAIYGGTSIILYMMSTLYHSFKSTRKVKKLFRIIDHCSIYLLIAGTYTPYSLVTLREASTALGWTVFGIIWGCAAVGITFTAIDMNKFKKIGIILYLIMGWMIIFTFKTLLHCIKPWGIIFMLLAGVIYTIGAVLYVIGKKKKFMHSVFHFFVVAASVLFFFSIFFYVI